MRNKPGTGPPYAALVVKEPLAVFEEHAEEVTAVVVTPDGARAISGSADCTLKVWDLQRTQPPQEGAKHGGEITAVVAAAQGHQLLTASADQTVRLWDGSTGALRKTLAETSHRVHGLAVTSDGRWVIAATSGRFLRRRWNPAEWGSYEGDALRMWDCETGKSGKTLRSPTKGKALAVAFTPDGQRVISSSSDGTLKIWDLTRRRLIQTLTGNRDEATALAVTHNGRWVVSASEYGPVTVWDCERGQARHTLDGCQPLAPLGAHPEGFQRVLSADRHGGLRVWDVEHGVLLRTLCESRERVRSLAVTPDEQYVVTSTGDNRLDLWSLVRSELVCSLELDCAVRGCTISPRGPTLVAGDQAGRLHLLRLVLPQDPVIPPASSGKV